LKKLLSVLLSALIALSVLPALEATAFASAVSGECGADLTWTYDEASKTLFISGEGDMYDYTSSTIPWKAYKAMLISVSIAEGASSIGDNSFNFCTALTTATLPSSILRIGASAFKDAFSFCEVRYTGTEEQWNEVAISSGNTYLNSATIQYLSACEAYGHDVDISSSSPPNCTESGFEEGVCRVCGKDIYTVTPALGHSFSTVVKIDDSHYSRTCSRCGSVDPLEPSQSGALFSVYGTSVGAGGSFSVPALITGNPGVWSVKVYVYFDPALTVTGITYGDVFKKSETTLNSTMMNAASNMTVAKAFSDCGVDPADYNCVCVLFMVDDLNSNSYSNGLLFTVNFEAPDEGGDYFVGILDSPGEVFDCLNNDIPFSFANSTVFVDGYDTHAHEWDGGVIITAPAPSVDGLALYTCSVCGRTKTAAVPFVEMPGDANGDGKVNARDITLIKKFIAGTIGDVYFDVYNSDFNGDEKINARDISAIKRFIAGN
jgi:hypothetical protein